jgi:hypothetical protein
LLCRLFYAELSYAQESTPAADNKNVWQKLFSVSMAVTAFQNLTMEHNFIE